MGFFHVFSQARGTHPSHVQVPGGSLKTKITKRLFVLDSPGDRAARPPPKSARRRQQLHLWGVRRRGDLRREQRDPGEPRRARGVLRGSALERGRHGAGVLVLGKGIR